MNKMQRGFTLIELVMVIVILGVLAAVALPRFVDLKGDAQAAATSGVAGALASAITINYASRSISTTKAGTAQVTTCTNAAALLQGGLPSGYTITGAAVTAGGTATCTVTGANSSTATFTAIGIS